MAALSPCLTQRDDGFSGTNFDRPAWKQMIEDIEAQRVNLVITKDLSRLGRDYIMAGQYTEIYFPSKGVRYIAVNDGYDSDSPYNDIAPLKNVLNEMYARDTSKKIRSAFLAKMEEGAYIGNFPPYGYRKDPDNKNHLLADPTASPVVEELFCLAKNGSSPSEIAGIFNAKGIMTPAVYRCAQHPGLSIDDYTKRREWTSSMVCKMLRNPVYLGHVVQGKTTKVSLKSHAAIRRPPEEWIVVRDMHEPLVSQETFENVQNRSVSRRNAPISGFKNIFSGIAVCADCGRNMSTTGTRKKGSAANLVCGGYKLYGKEECSNHFIAYEVLYQVVQKEIRSLLLLTVEERAELIEKVSAMVGTEGKEACRTEKRKARELELDLLIGRLYEDRVSGRLSDDRFYRLLASFEAEQKAAADRAGVMTESGPENEGKKEACEKPEVLLQGVTEVKELTPELLKRFVKKIEICQGSCKRDQQGQHKCQTVRIYYRCTG